MLKRWRVLLVVFLLGALLSANGTKAHPPLPQEASLLPARAEAASDSSVMFIENVGQFAGGARFQVWGGDRITWLAEDGIWITVQEPAPPQPQDSGEEARSLLDRRAEESQARHGVNLKLTFPGANPHPRLEPFNRLKAHVSYFLGGDPDQWHADAPVWGGVRYVDLYPGIDLEVTAEGGQMVQRLVAHSGADLSAVRLQVDGADALALDGDWLRVTTVLGKVVLPLLEVSGAAPDVGHPVLESKQLARPFAPGPSGPSPSATVDSRSDLLYGTFVGASGEDGSDAIAVDGAGNAYVVGYTWSPGFPTTPGAFDTSFNNGTPIDTFVIKVNPGGDALLYSTFLGGYDADWGFGIAVDGGGNAYVTGVTISPDFPTTPDASDTIYNGRGDAFVAKLNPAGSALVYATFLGGSEWDGGNGIAVDGGGNAYVTGGTSSSDFPTTPGAFDTSYNGGDYDAFVAKLNPRGSAVLYATVLGGSQSEMGQGIAVDGGGNAHVAGYTLSSNFPTMRGALDTTYNGGDYDAFVAKLNPAGSALVYATFLGGSGEDRGYSIALDGGGNAYVTGLTESSDFPATPGAFDTSYNGGDYDAFVAKLNPAGSGLVYATFLGGNSSGPSLIAITDAGIAVDGSGNAYVTGGTSSSDFPTTPGAFDTSYNNVDTFVAKLNPAGSALIYATFLGGSGWDNGNGIAVDGGGDAYVTGYTYSPDFPTTPDAFDTSYHYNHNTDAFVAKLAMRGGPMPDLGMRYDGPPYLSDANVVDEADQRISMGDHVHVRLDFRNAGSQTMFAATVEIIGTADSADAVGVGICDDSTCSNQRRTVTLSRAVLEPGQSATADFWIYVSNPDPAVRQTRYGATQFQVQTDAERYTISILLSPILFDIPTNKLLKSASCLHHPGNLEIERYAQYAAACPSGSENGRSTTCDPDTAKQAISNVVSRVNQEFEYLDGDLRAREEDFVLLSTRGGFIGQCRHFADLTVGLLRSLGFPSRLVGADMKDPNKKPSAHAWVEVDVGTGTWEHADPTAGVAFYKRSYEEAAGYRVLEAWADRFPLCSASSASNPQYRCIASCYTTSPNCDACRRESNQYPRIAWPDQSCVEDVTSDYHRSSAQGVELATAGQLVVQLDAPTFVTRTIPFAVSTGVTNDSATALGPITVTLGEYGEWASTLPLYAASPDYQVITDLGAGQGVTLTWVVTSLVSGAGLPLRALAESGESFALAEEVVVVNVPGTLPDLSVSALVSPNRASPGGSITLATYVLDEYLRLITNGDTAVTATVFATPTLGFSTAVGLHPDPDGMYRGGVILPGTAPIGKYQVDLVATCPGKDPGRTTTFFFVAPALSMTLTTNLDSFDVRDAITLTVRVSERGTVLTDAGVWAQIITPGGAVTVPLVIGLGNAYTFAFRPVDLEADLGGRAAPGRWLIQAMADYEGSEASIEKAVLVRSPVYLPVIVKRRVGG